MVICRSMKILQKGGSSQDLMIEGYSGGLGDSSSWRMIEQYITQLTKLFT